MTDNNTRAMALAAASVLGLSLGMASLTANAEQVKGQTSTQIKGETSNQVKGQSNQIKFDGSSKQGKFFSNYHKTTTGSNQIKWNGVSNQHKSATPSPDLNPQPEPPKPTNQSKPQ